MVEKKKKNERGSPKTPVDFKSYLGLNNGKYSLGDYAVIDFFIERYVNKKWQGRKKKKKFRQLGKGGSSVSLKKSNRIHG